MDFLKGIYSAMDNFTATPLGRGLKSAVAVAAGQAATVFMQSLVHDIKPVLDTTITDPTNHLIALAVFGGAVSLIGRLAKNMGINLILI
jgi:hypothetical protein